jgi:hypothetical protein
VLYVHNVEHRASQKQWVARIVGISPRFGFEREFVRPRKDYRNAKRGMSGRAGIGSVFLLEADWVCEFNQWENWKEKRYFALVTVDGLRHMSEDKVIEWLRSSSARSVSTR